MRLATRAVALRRDARARDGRLLPRGRGAGLATPNRFVASHVEPALESLAELAASDGDGTSPPRLDTTLYDDRSRSILSENDSPDIPFRYAVNPYRGCEHGCTYCYARPYHEYLGWSAGFDFESRLLVKRDAPELLRRAIARPRYEPGPIAFSGVTDAWQPIERRLELTRRCLDVLVDAGHPFGTITKSHLITRDIDLLARAARMTAAEAGTTGASAGLSITTLDPQLARAMEPRASSPAMRLDALRQLSEAGVPTFVMVAPVIPGLTDHEIPAILTAAREAGARFAGYVMLRLPHAVRDLFLDWLDRCAPQRKAKVVARLRDLRGERLTGGGFGERMRGRGVYAEHVASLVRTTAARLGFDRERMPHSCVAFRRPVIGQQRLFD